MIFRSVLSAVLFLVLLVSCKDRQSGKLKADDVKIAEMSATLEAISDRNKDLVIFSDVGTEIAVNLGKIGDDSYDKWLDFIRDNQKTAVQIHLHPSHPSTTGMKLLFSLPSEKLADLKAHLDKDKTSLINYQLAIANSSGQVGLVLESGYDVQLSEQQWKLLRRTKTIKIELNYDRQEAAYKIVLKLEDNAENSKIALLVF